MPITKAIAKKDLTPYFKKGDKITVIPILYEKDTLLVNEIFGIFKDNVFVKIFELMDTNRNMKGLEIIKISEKVFAPKGSYKDSIIKVKNRREYPSSIVRDYNEYFEKV